MPPRGPLRLWLRNPDAWLRGIVIVLGGCVLIQLGGCVESLLPAAVAVAEQMLLSRLVPVLPLFSW